MPNTTIYGLAPLPLLALCAALGCEQHHVTRPSVGLERTSAHPLTIFPLDLVEKTGDPLFVIYGGPLDGGVTVDLLIELDSKGSNNCDLQNEWFAFTLDSGQIYIAQYNSWCGTTDACRVLDPKTQRLEQPPGGCLPAPSLGIHYRASPIGHGWVRIDGDAEGCAETLIGAYTPEDGFTQALELQMGNLGSLEEVRFDGETLHARSGCDLSKGGCAFGEEPTTPRSYTYTTAGGWR